METTIINKVPELWIDQCKECGTTTMNIPVANGKHFRVFLDQTELNATSDMDYSVSLEDHPHPVMYNPKEIWGVEPKDIKKIAEIVIDKFWRDLEERVLNAIYEDDDIAET